LFFFNTFQAITSTIHETSFPLQSLRANSDDICDDNAFTSINYADDVLFTYLHVVARSRAHHTLSSRMLNGCQPDAINMYISNDIDDLPSLVSDFDDPFSFDDDDDILQVAIRTIVCDLPTP
jgi:hypothetical protein